MVVMDNTFMSKDVEMVDLTFLALTCMLVVAFSSLVRIFRECSVIHFLPVPLFIYFFKSGD